MGSDWFSGNVILSNRVGGTPRGCYEEQQSWNMRPLPGAGRKEAKKYGREKEKKK